MATYIAVVSLMHDLEQLLASYDSIFGSSSELCFCPITKKEMEILYDSVSSMDSLLRDSSGQSYHHELMNQMLEKRILDLGRHAGNYLDFWAAQCLQVRESTRFNTLALLELCLPERVISEYPNMNEITQDIISINEELEKKIGNKGKVQDLEITSSTGKFSTFLSPSTRTLNTEGKLVGLEKDLLTMLERLTRQISRLTVLSIIGMAGIGKTTFARKLYDDPLVLHHFHVRAWVTVSQQYQVREMLLHILCCVTNTSDEIYGRSDEELREQVYRNLKGRKYLIVLDDMWCTKAWDELKRTFPDDKNGSRIMLTSRLRDVAVHASQDAPPHSLRCLNINESWELLSSKILVDEYCSQELVEIGKQIAYKCQGLPLALVIVGGLLSKMNKKLDLWEEVAQSVGSLVMGEVEGCHDILALSYNHLPDQLKACFLYMGIFPEDYEISVKKLIWLWIAEGFIRPTTLKSLEEVAEDYLEDLISRSLILVRTSFSNRRIKACYIHDLMRELCLRESRKQNFLHVIDHCGQLPLITKCDDFLGRYGSIKVPRDIHNLRRLSFHSSIRTYFRNRSFLCTHSVMCFEKLFFSEPRISSGMELRLLKVLDFMNIRLRQIPVDIHNLTLLKFLALTSYDPLHVMRLRWFLSLQTLILDCEWGGHLPRIFWDMLELRHFHLKKSCLSHSPLELELVDEEPPLRVLNNLR